VQPYPGDYGAVVTQARQELASGARPALRARLDDIGSYDVVFVGFPNWCNTFPAPVGTFLSEHDLAGKSVAPFCTHGSGGLGRCAADISELCPKATVLTPLALKGADVSSAQSQVADWLGKLKL